MKYVLLVSIVVVIGCFLVAFVGIYVTNKNTTNIIVYQKPDDWRINVANSSKSLESSTFKPLTCDNIDQFLNRAQYFESINNITNIEELTRNVSNMTQCYVVAPSKKSTDLLDYNNVNASPNVEPLNYNTVLTYLTQFKKNITHYISCAPTDYSPNCDKIKKLYNTIIDKLVIGNTVPDKELVKQNYQLLKFVIETEPQ
jgi:hypothetical protein